MLHDAPALLRHRLPGHVSGVATALARPHALGQAADDYLRSALTVVAALTFAAALLIMPRRFSTEAGEYASTGPRRNGVTRSRRRC